MKFEFEDSPRPGQQVSVVDDIGWCYMPLPFALDHVNCWLLGEPGQQLLVDTGVDNGATRACWQSVFEASGHWPEHLLVTHFHPDHIGLAGWFGQQGCRRFSGSEQEIDIALSLSGIDDSDYALYYAQWYAEHGLPDSALSTVKASGNTYRGKVHLPPERAQWAFLNEGQTLQIAGRAYTVMIGRGHAPDMIMLYRADDHVLIAADQVLPSISPNVSVMPRLTDNNPLSSFLFTLTQLESLPDDTLVLPSHGLPFRGLKGRLQALRQHHQQRLEQVFDACQAPHSAYELFPVLYRRALDAQQTSFALGEALAHLHYLEHQGRIERQVTRGLARFCAC